MLLMLTVLKDMAHRPSKTGAVINAWHGHFYVVPANTGWKSCCAIRYHWNTALYQNGTGERLLMKTHGILASSLSPRKTLLQDFQYEGPKAIRRAFDCNTLLTPVLMPTIRRVPSELACRPADTIALLTSAFI